MIDKFYAFVEDESDENLSNIQTLPNGWRNISGLCFLPDPDLRELGWIKITDPDALNYTCSDQLLEQFKYRLCDEVANLRWEAQTDAITYNENVYVLTESTTNALYHKRTLVANNLDSTYNWKTRDGVVELTGNQIVGLTDAIHNYIQNCFDIEADFASLILSKQSLKSLLEIDYNITWPSIELS